MAPGRPTNPRKPSADCNFIIKSNSIKNSVEIFSICINVFLLKAGIILGSSKSLYPTDPTKLHKASSFPTIAKVADGSIEKSSRCHNGESALVPSLARPTCGPYERFSGECDVSLIRSRSSLQSYLVCHSCKSGEKAFK